MPRRGVTLLSAFVLLAACQPQRPPATSVSAVPTPGGIGLPAASGAPRYDTVAPVDETRAASRTSVRNAPPARVEPAPPSERERRAIEAWNREEAVALNGSAPLAVAPPPRNPNALAMPAGSLDLPMPQRPGIEPRGSTARQPRETAPAPPNRAERPAPVAVAAAQTPAPAPPAPSSPETPPPPSATSAEVPAVVVPAPASPAATPTASPAAPPRVAATAPTDVPRVPPAGPPLASVIFDARSADLSDAMRLVLGLVAKDAEEQRVRRIELWAAATGNDPADARKIALARALAVHAYLIDLGVKARIEIGGFSEAPDPQPDRVDLLRPR